MGVIFSFPFILPGFIAFYGVSYYFKTKHITKLNKLLPQSVTNHLTKKSASTKQNGSSTISIEISSNSSESSSNSSESSSNSRRSSSKLSESVSQSSSSSILSGSSSKISSSKDSKFYEIATQPHTDIFLLKSQVEKENYSWEEYLGWLKKYHPDNFSALFKLSLESEKELQFVLKTLNLNELEEQCEKLDKDDQITIIFPNKEIHLSKKLLTLFIPYYQTAFSGKFNDINMSQISMPIDVDSRVFKNTLNFLLFGKKIMINGANIHKFLQFANYINEPSFLQVCEQWVIDNAGDIEILDLIELNEKYELSQNFKSYLQKRVNKEAHDVIKVMKNGKTRFPKSMKKIAPYVSELNLGNFKISNLKFLKFFPNVQSLKLPSSIDDNKLATLPHLNSLKHLNLSGCDITEESLALIANLTQLQSLDLSYIKIRYFKWPFYIDGLTQLKTLNLAGIKFVSYWLRYLSDLTDLQSLNLNNTDVTDEELFYIKNMTQLQSLRLHRVKITDAGLVHIANLTQLQSLDLSETNITDAGLSHIVNLTQLQSLNVGWTKVTSAGFVHIVKLTQLQLLDLSRTHVSNARLAYLANLTQLKFLDLSRNYITDEGLANLASLTQLRSLSLIYTHFTDAGLVHIAKLAQLQSLDLSFTKVTKAGLSHIANLNQLQLLNLFATEVKKADVAQYANLVAAATFRIVNLKGSFFHV